jgi:hypothetical protein
MPMDWIHAIYWTTLLAGLLYTVVSLVFGGAARGPLHPWSPAVLAFALAAFGATGVILREMLPPQTRGIEMMPALVVGGLLGWAFFALGRRLLTTPPAEPPASTTDAPVE